MAYTPINWQTGDTISADKLNKMDNGWGVESTQLFSETVTTVDTGQGFSSGAIAYSSVIDAASITVTFDGTDYDCSRIDAFGDYFYGGFSKSGLDFSTYPFAIESIGGGGENAIKTEAAGTYTITAVVSTLQTSADFDTARGYGYVTGYPTELFSETVTTADDGNGNNVADLPYPLSIDAGTITVTFDGTEYTCPRIDSGEAYAYGGFTIGPDFTECPFFIWSKSQVNQLITQTAGEHTIAVVAALTSMETSADFDKAAQTAMASTIAAVPTPFLVTIGTTTFGEVVEAIAMGKIPVIVYNNTISNQPKYIEIIVYAIWSSSVKAIKAITAISDVVEVRTYTADSKSSPIYRVTSS